MSSTFKGNQGYLQRVPVINPPTGGGGRDVRSSMAAADVIDLDEGTSRGTRRGRKGRSQEPGKVKAASIVDQLPPQYLDSVPDDLQAKLSIPYSSIREMLSDTDNGVRGIGLELLALRTAIDLRLRPAGFRLRAGKSTGGTQTELMAESLRLLFSRWTVHCMHSVADVHVDQVAEAVGLATTMGSNVIVMVSTAGFSGPALIFADDVTRNNPLQFAFINGNELVRYFTEGEEWLANHLSRWVERTATLKSPRVIQASADDQL